ncbi:hypothetical protein Tco_0874384 [Tanacetum coccineum]|uniref:Uncharacterized protein n=1 Tax=Tanacetum coccineum TaxID=301880 RepID=A0ABQ5BQ53_9ASTR
MKTWTRAVKQPRQEDPDLRVKGHHDDKSGPHLLIPICEIERTETRLLSNAQCAGSNHTPASIMVPTTPRGSLALGMRLPFSTTLHGAQMSRAFRVDVRSLHLFNAKRVTSLSLVATTDPSDIYAGLYKEEDGKPQCSEVKKLRSDNGTEFRNHKLEEFCDEKVAKAFRMFNIRRQEMEETVHVTFSEDDEAISQTTTEGDAINFNENRSIPDDEFIEPRTKDTQCSVNIEYFTYVSAYKNITLAVLPTLQISVTFKEPLEFTIAGDLLAIHEHAESADILESAEPQDNVLSESISDDQPALVISPSAEVILQNPIPQDRWSREKHIELVNIIGKSLAGITTRSRIRDSDAALAHECLYVNFLSEIEPKKLIEALEEEGWVIAMQ